jgi:anti-sigma factor ChrR (cupin superfamily)
VSQIVRLNADMQHLARMDTSALEWAPSPSGSVWRKRVHMMGGAESGQVTSLVRYEPGACFPLHDHPEGEEILVLEGTFSDEHGDWRAGTHLLNPEGFRHAPFSQQGCVIFVKLRQYAGAGREYRKTEIERLAWHPTNRAGVEEKILYDEPGFPDVTRLERWSAGAAPGPIETPGGSEIFVLEGALEDASGRCEVGTWLRFPDGGVFDARSSEGCVLYSKAGAVSTLRSAS